MSRPAPQPVPRPAPPPPRRTLWPWALLLVAAVAVAVVGFLAYDQAAHDPGPTPPAVSPTLPPQLRQDLQQLQDEVAS